MARSTFSRLRRSASVRRGGDVARGSGERVLVLPPPATPRSVLMRLAGCAGSSSPLLELEELSSSEPEEEELLLEELPPLLLLLLLSSSLLLLPLLVLLLLLSSLLLLSLSSLLLLLLSSLLSSLLLLLSLLLSCFFFFFFFFWSSLPGLGGRARAGFGRNSSGSSLASRKRCLYNCVSAHDPHFKHCLTTTPPLQS